MKDKLDIFSITYKNYEQIVKNDIYKVINVSDEKIDTTLEVLSDKNGVNINSLNSFFSELTGTYWVWKNYQLKDYVGICQYRRYFAFLDNIPNMDEIFEKYDVILPTPYKYTHNMAIDYHLCHNLKDLLNVIEIIRVKYPDYYDSAIKFCQSKSFYPCNMFIMKKSDFIEYCEFVFGVMEEYLKEIKCSTMDDIIRYVKNHWGEYCKTFSPNNEVWYQSRIGGFLAERLLNIFIIKKFSNVKEEKWIMTHKKYNFFS